MCHGSGPRKGKKKKKKRQEKKPQGLCAHPCGPVSFLESLFCPSPGTSLCLACSPAHECSILFSPQMSAHWKHFLNLFIKFFFFFGLFAISWAAPMAYGGSQARGLIGAVATGLARATATQDPRHICNLHHRSRQCQILNPLSKGRD